MKIRFRMIPFLIALLGPLFDAASSRADLVVIVNSKNPVKELSRKFLADTFLKKITFWNNGESIQPIDLQANSQTRKQFSEQILGRPVIAIRSYWQQQIFSGQAIPPVEYDREDQVVKFVGSHSSAVGYVSNTTALNPAVKSVPLK